MLAAMERRMTVTEERFRYEGQDGTGLAGFRWSAPGKAKAAIQLAHGAGEHAMRYFEVLKPIVEAGYVVYAADHRGHGMTSGMTSLGDFGPGGAPAAVDDMAVLMRLIAERESGLRRVLFGHSMGAMFSQAWLTDHSELIDALVLSGTAGPAPIRAEAINARFEPARTPYDWLSRDPAEVDKYIADPFCGIRFKPDSQASFMTLRERRLDPETLAKIKPGLPVYIFVGDADPINDGLQRHTPLVDAYKAAGLDVTLKVYPGGRHEMLNETNRDEVVADLRAWLDGAVAA
jgi:alpha-beta hydrolase superfamily lysophospholipase